MRKLYLIAYDICEPGPVEPRTPSAQGLQHRRAEVGFRVLSEHPDKRERIIRVDVSAGKIC